MAKTDITAINAKTLSVNGVPVSGSGAPTGPVTTFDQIDADTVLALNGVVLFGTLPAGAVYTNFSDINVTSGVSVAETVRYGVAAGGGTSIGYDIWPILGQSNAKGMANRDSSDTEVAGAYQFGGASTTSDYQKIIASIVPLQHPANDGRYGPGEAFAKAIVPLLPAGRRILLVPCAVNSTELVASPARWKSGNPGGTLYENAISQTNLAIAAAKAEFPSSRIAGMLWVQGEQDAISITGPAYLAELYNVIAGFRARMTDAANVPFVIGGMMPELIRDGDGGSTTPAGMQAINFAHIDASVGGTKVLHVPGNFGQKSGDAYHYNLAGYRANGAAWVAALNRATPPVITTATTANVVSGSPLAIDLAADVWATFEISGGADASQFEIVRSGVTGRGVYTLRFASNGTKDFATPTDTGANNVYDVNVRARDGSGNFSAPQPIAITVTASGAPTLGALALSAPITNGTASSGTITGAASGSTITSNVTGLTVNSGARTYSWDGTGAVGTTANGLVETLAGATNSPRNNSVTVAAAAGVAESLTLTSAAFGTGKFGQAMSGGNALVPTSVMPASRVFPFTVEAWFISTSTNLQVIAGQKNGSAIGWYFGLNTDGRVIAQTAPSGQTIFGPVCNDGLYHHAALVMTATGVRLYVDGALASSHGGTPAATTTQVNVRTYVGQYGFVGGVDELAFFSGERYTGSTYTVPAAAYAAGVPNAIGIYHLDGDGTGIR